MRMALGDFRFIVPAFTIDQIEDEVSARVARQDIVASTPITHLLGPGTDTLELKSTFFPLHLNNAGPALVAGLQAVCRAQTPLPMLQVQGLTGFPMGRWVITKVGRSRDRFAAVAGIAQVIEVSMSLERYTRQGGAGGLLGILS